MKNSTINHGFKKISSVAITDIEATLHKMEHEKSGARLLFLEREDENKTFSIAFKTIPEDSTGVFHIIEHSVLCGSEKYKAKEPFVELLKGSLNTFLNAMTFPDKTVYPVASRNDRDFLNLMSVYLDAVFHPAILENKNIFLQEGWHYELDSEDGELTRNGVVLNEMRGAFSSPDDLAYYNLSSMLYPDTCYRHDSGGNPKHITDLTYEEFLAAHKKYYHPSNAEIFLDGSVDLDAALAMIDSYLSEYEKMPVNFEIETQKPIKPVRREIKYEISPSESEKNKTRMALGYLLCRYDEQEKNVAASILMDTVCSSNESPLKKALIDSGLCEDVTIAPYDSIKQNALGIEFHNVKDGASDELYELFADTVKKIASEGIDKSMLEASLNSFEFKTREKDFGTMPKGVIYAMSVLEASLYGGAPEQNLSFEKTFTSIRAKLGTDYFEKLLAEIFLNNEHRAMLIMYPSATLGEEKAKEEKQILSDIKSSLSKEELQQIIATNESLKEWQKTPDTPESIASIPQLKISDIGTDVPKIPQEVKNIDGVTVLTQDIATGGIVYTELYFDVSDLTKEEIFELRLLLSLMENVRTEKHTAIELQNQIKRDLGTFSATMTPVTKGGKAKMYVNVSASALDSKKDSIIDILSEVLYTSVYNDKNVARNILRQMKIASDESFITGGHLAGYHRAAAYVNSEAAILEYYSGYEAHLSIKALDKNFDSDFDSLSERLSSLVKRIFTRSRLTLSITAKPDEAFTKKLIDSLDSGEKAELVCGIQPFGIRREGIAIPAQAAYAESASNLSLFGEKVVGSMNVVRSLLNYGYLWNAVRVQGGAYGVGLLIRNNGNIGFYSYRDPSPSRTLSCYKESGSFLRSFAESGEDISKFIIGAVGDTSPLMTPKLKGTVASTRYLRGITYEDECRTRREILATDKAELLRIADIIDKVSETDAVCVVGGKDKLEACELDVILEI